MVGSCQKGPLGDGWENWACCDVDGRGFDVLTGVAVDSAGDRKRVSEELFPNGHCEYQVVSLVFKRITM